MSMFSILTELTCLHWREARRRLERRHGLDASTNAAEVATGHPSGLRHDTLRLKTCGLRHDGRHDPWGARLLWK